MVPDQTRSDRGNRLFKPSRPSVRPPGSAAPTRPNRRAPLTSAASHRRRKTLASRTRRLSSQLGFRWASLT